MYSIIRSPVKCKHIGEMSDHLKAWDRKIDDVVVMGDQGLNDAEMCIIALNMLPANTSLSWFDLWRVIPISRRWR